jgi:mannitol/fructose-specific phosphotransferase system IIA component (Ntr-type)
MFYMGFWPVAFTVLTILLAYLWYRFFVRSKVKREGAIFHWFALLGKFQHDDLESEFLTILREKGLRQDDPFNETIVRSKVGFESGVQFIDLVNKVSGNIARELNISSEKLSEEFLKTNSLSAAFLIPEVSVLTAKIPEIPHPVLHLVISESGISKPVNKNGFKSTDTVKVFFFLVNAEELPRQQLRMLSGIMDIGERDHFVKDMLSFSSSRQVIEYLLHDKQYISFKLTKDSPSEVFIDKKLMQVQLPPDVLVVMVDRNDLSFAPNGKTLLQENDTITVIGNINSINKMVDQYILDK